MKISVVMTTFNGERFILQQLDSILNQTKRADEVLIFDDRSNDNTPLIVSEYIQNKQLDNWSFRVNDINKGWQRNFMEGIAAASGDIVFLADQDDIWHPQKLEMMSRIMMDDTNIDLLVCNHMKFHMDDEIQVVHYEKEQYRKIDSVPSNNMTGFPGCAYCVRKAFFDTIKSAWIEKYAHDGLIYLAAWMKNSIYFCDNTLLYYRRHEQSVTIHAHVMNKKSIRVSYVKNRRVVVEKLLHILGEDSFTPQCIEFLGYLQLREELLNGKKYINIIKLVKHLKYYQSVATLATDIVVAIKN